MPTRMRPTPIDNVPRRTTCSGIISFIHRLIIPVHTRIPCSTVTQVSASQTFTRAYRHDTSSRNYGWDTIDHGTSNRALQAIQSRDHAYNFGASRCVFNRGKRLGDQNTFTDKTKTPWALDAGFKSLRTLHTGSFNRKKSDTADATLARKVERPVKHHNTTAAAAAQAKPRSSRRHRLSKDEVRDSQSRMAPNGSNMSVDELWLTARHTKKYADAARMVDSLLDNRELRCKDGVAAINIYKLSRQPHKCVRILEYVHRKGGRLLAKHYSPCIAALNTSGDYSKAEALYEEMQARGVQSNVTVSNTMIQLYVNTPNIEKAMSLFRDIPCLGIAPTVYTYSILMSALNRTNQWERALELYEQMVHEGVERNTRTCNAAITACKKGKQWIKALEILNEMEVEGLERDTVTYNSAISACTTGHRLDKAIALFDEMEANGVERNTITYNSMITACEKVGDWSRALNYVKTMQNAGVTADTITYNSAISACGSAHRLEKAIAVFQEMEANGIKSDTITCNSMIAACEKVGDWSRALFYLKDMNRKGIPANTVTYNTAISACGEGKRLDRAVDLMGRMVVKGIARDVITYTNIISACEKVGDWKKAVGYLDEMVIDGIERNTITYNSVISACADTGEWKTAIDLFKEMGRKRIERDATTYGVAIRACGRGNEVEKAMGLFNAMEGRGITRDAVVYVAAMSAYEVIGQYEKAIALFDEMDAAKVNKDIQCYTTAIEALGGISTEHPRIDPLYEDMTVRFPMYRKFWSALASGGQLDLHDHSKRMAQAAIRRLLRLLLAQHRDSSQKPRLKLDCIIVGKGQNSTEGGVLLDTVRAQLHGLYPPIASYTPTENVGRLILNQHDLEQWLEFNTQTISKL